MCGIVGYTGTKLAKDVLIEGLRRLEYRGYDSAGIALQEAGGLSVTRRVGKVEGLAEAVADMPSASTCGIGHTRWATHGAPSERNAHPHVSCDGQIAVVHNGIIENFQELREKLAAQGHTFRSDTDTEVVAHLVEGYYREGDLLAAVARATQDIIGAYGLAITCAAEPGRIVATRKDSPIVLAHGEAGSYVASDIIAVIEASRDVAVLGDGQLADMRPDGITYYNAELERNLPAVEVTHVDLGRGRGGEGRLPRLHAEGDSRAAARHPRHAGRPPGQRRAVEIDELGMTPEELRLVDRVYIVACGTSYHAGLMAKPAHRRLGPHPHGGGGRERVPLPQPDYHPLHARGGRLAVRRNRRHPCRDPRGPHQGRQGLWHHQRHRQPGGPRKRRRDLHEG
jgi:glucosamine--fructose-6-phosphate aminotransferase (isomerizing)